MPDERIPLKLVVEKLIGPIYPVGEHNTDIKRLKNLEDAIALAEWLNSEIRDVATKGTFSHEGSVIKAGERADKYFRNLKEDLNG